MMEKLLHAALDQHRLMRAEKDLLEHTLMSSINVLMDVLSLTNPVAFGRTSRVAFLVKQVALKLKVENAWELEAAAMLSQIGCVTIPTQVLEKAYAGKDISTAESTMFEQYPIIGHDLVAKIPRLENVAAIILRQLQECDRGAQDTPLALRDNVSLGAEMLRVCIDFDALLSQGETWEHALDVLKQRSGNMYNPLLLDILPHVDRPTVGKKICVISVYDLRTDMVVEEDVVSKKGACLMRKGHKVTLTARMLLENYVKRNALEDTIIVSVEENIG
jgi:response regulator RpfG family c-di-GMP phosphodiesterase